MDRFSLKNNVCLITGGAGLIGRGFSRACACAGATVVIVDINEKSALAVAEKINREKLPGRVVVQKCDITNENDVVNLIKTVTTKYKRIDALVNNAFPRNNSWGTKFEDISYKDFCGNLDIHVGGYFLMTREVVKVMKKQKSGTIVNMGSIYGVSAPKFDIYEGSVYGQNDDRQRMAGKRMTVAAEYSAIKGAVLNLTKYLASYLGKYNIRVNAISPGGVFDKQPKNFVEKYCKMVPLCGRMANPDDLNYVLVFLLSDAARYITGHNIMVDGGWSL